MQLVSDLQQRPRKGRLPMEKRIVGFYDLCSLVQLVSWVVHTVQTTIGAHRTFKENFFVQSDFVLADAIVYKTDGCVYNSTRSIYAFTGVTTSFTPNSINDVFVDNAIQMRLGIFIMATAFFVGAVNRVCVEVNFFVLKTRNFYFWKDIISAAELLLISYVFVIAVSAQPPAQLLKDYLKYCGIESSAYLPFAPAAALYVFGGGGFATYVLGGFLYLWNTLPKYGIMTPAEIDEYKEWLRKRKAEKEQSRAFIEQAKQAQARMMLLQTAEYPTGTGAGHPPHPSVTPAASMGATPMMYPMTPIPPMTPEQQAAMSAASGANPYMYMYPYTWMEGMPQMAPNPNLPPPQLFGMQPSLNVPPPSGVRGPVPVTGPPHYVNMPRRRITSPQRLPSQASGGGGVTGTGGPVPDTGSAYTGYQ